MKEKTTDREQKGWGPGPRGPCRALRGLSCVTAAPATRGFPSSLCKGHSQTRPGCSPHALGSRSLWGPQQGIRIKGITAHQLSLLRWVPVPERSGGGGGGDGRFGGQTPSREGRPPTPPKKGRRDRRRPGGGGAQGGGGGGGGGGRSGLFLGMNPLQQVEDLHSQEIFGFRQKVCS